MLDTLRTGCLLVLRKDESAVRILVTGRARTWRSYFSAGVMFEVLGKLGSAEQILRRGLEVHPLNRKLRERLIALYRNKKQWDVARQECLQLCLTVQRESKPHASYLLGTIEVKLSMFEDALRSFGRAITDRRYGEHALYGVALCHHRLGNKEEARKALNELLRSNRSHFDGLLLRAIMLAEEGKKAEAAVLAEGLLKSGPQSEELKQLLAYVRGNG